MTSNCCPHWSMWEQQPSSLLLPLLLPTAHRALRQRSSHTDDSAVCKVVIKTTVAVAVVVVVFNILPERKNASGPRRNRGSFKMQVEIKHCATIKVNKASLDALKSGIKRLESNVHF